MKLTAKERFWSKVNVSTEGNCWEWQASFNGNGYGSFYRDGKEVNAMVFSLEQKLGRLLVKDECALHTCDNKKCVNPKHLYVGSRKDNAQDWLERGGRGGLVYKTKRMIDKSFDSNFDDALDLVENGYHENEIKRVTGISVYVIRDMKSQL